MGAGMLPNHTYHVLNVPKRMGHQEVEATVEFMDSCRVSWGKVTAINGPHVTLAYEPLVANGGLLALGSETPKTVMRRLEADYDIEMLKVGEYVTLHWDVPCEVVKEEEVECLRRYTLRALRLANGIV